MLPRLLCFTSMNSTARSRDTWDTLLRLYLLRELKKFGTHDYLLNGSVTCLVIPNRSSDRVRSR